MLFPLADLVQRIIVANLIRLHPSRRDSILTRWIRWCARITLRGLVQRLGGARIDPVPELSARPGMLVLMNHQSLLDIPIALQTIRQHYPWIVTRRRYASGIPLVSHMLRLYDMPLVDPGDRSSSQLEELAERARTADRPLLIFPEGGRTRDGQIRPFKKAGLRAILPQRRWEVYLLVVDGYWRCARLADFARTVHRVRGRSRLVGPFPYVPESDAPDDFTAEMRRRLQRELAALREDATGERSGSVEVSDGARSEATG